MLTPSLYGANRHRETGGRDAVVLGAGHHFGSVRAGIARDAVHRVPPEAAEAEAAGDESGEAAVRAAGAVRRVVAPVDVAPVRHPVAAAAGVALHQSAAAHHRHRRQRVIDNNRRSNRKQKKMQCLTVDSSFGRRHDVRKEMPGSLFKRHVLSCFRIVTCSRTIVSEMRKAKR